LEQTSILVDSRGCEFGYELIMVLPFVYWLHSQNKDVAVVTCQHMKDFYFFLTKDKCIEKYKSRTDIIPPGLPLKGIHFENLDTDKWEVPNFREFYSSFDLPFTTTKPILLVSNKYTQEWKNAPVNFIPLQVLNQIFTKLKDTYQIVYNRPHSNKITVDTQRHYEFGDYELIKDKHPEVINLNNVETRLNYNLLQLIIGSKTSKFISVQGGSSILSSLFGGTNIILAKKGSELKFNSYNWYSKFSGASILWSQKDDIFLEKIFNTY